MSTLSDHGLEVIRKSGEEVTPGNKSDYFLKVGLTGPFEVPKDADTITAQYPDSVTEVFEYRTGGLTGTILKTFTIVYTSSTKDLIESVVKS